MLGFDLASVAALERFSTEFDDLGKIGTGGFSTVSKVRNKRDRKLYALKTIRIKPSEFRGQVADYLEKVLSEAKVLSGLKHPNILQYNSCWINADPKTPADFLEEDHTQPEEEELELVMEQYSQNSCGFEFQHRESSKQKKSSANNKANHLKPSESPTDNIFGTDLQQYREIRMYLLSELGEHSLQKYVYARNQHMRMNEIQIKKMAVQNYKFILDIVEGLLYIHSQKVIHRDLKLQNVIIDGNKRCKIIDFGLAKRVRNLKSLNIEKFQHRNVPSDECEQEKHSSSVGTKIFSSPEQSNSQNYDHRTDIYSLGMMIGILFSHYKTSHQQSQILLSLRNRKLDDFKIDERLKSLLYRCLSEQKHRPDLKQLKNCVRKLLRQQLASNQEQPRIFRVKNNESGPKQSNFTQGQKRHYCIEK